MATIVYFVWHPNILVCLGWIDEKACYDDTLVLGDWVLVGRPVYFQNKRDIQF